MERIVAAAIKAYTDEDTYPFIYTGKRHADIFEQMYKLGIKYNKNKSIQGFLTDTWRFVDRYEAKRIAVKANQLIVPIEETYDELFSEDLW